MLKKLFVTLTLIQLAFLAQACATPATGASARTADVHDCVAGFSGGKVVTNELDKCLKTDGVRLEIHGVVPEQRLAVATFRNKQDFFVFEHLSLLGATPQIREEILKLNRHDSVIVKGEIAALTAPQKHVRALSFTVENKSKSSEELDGYPYDAKIPEDLINSNQFTGVVHAIFGEGSILVVEYKDAVVPVFVEPQFTAFTKDLYRNDMVEMFYQIQAKPGRPMHLNLVQPAAPNIPLRVTESMLAQHGQKVRMTGELAMFPKSPQVLFNVFALRKELGHGLRRYYTLVNFEDPKIFTAVREKLQKIWDASESSKVKDRNKWSNPKLIIEAEGTLNVQDANQANPQILLESVESVRLVP
jgi:hypothetical protein